MAADPNRHTLVNVARFLPEAASLSPDRPAVIAPQKNWRGQISGYELTTFRELDCLCGRAAAFFKSQGIQQGQRALVMVRPGTDLIVCAFTLFRLGVVPVLIDPGMGLKSFLRCVERSQPDVLLGIPLAHRVSRLFKRNFSTVRHRIVVGGNAYRQALHRDPETAIPPQAHTTADTLAAVLFTSGSTGIPKGVCYEHGMFEAQIRLLREAYQFGADEVDLPMLPIFALFNPALGMTTVVPAMNPSRPATVNPRNIVQAIQQWQVTNSFGSPVLWKKIAAYCRENQITLPSVRRILIAGAPVSPQVLRELKAVIPNGEIFTPYGATECLPVSHIAATEILESTWQQTETGKGTCVGRLFPEMNCAILPVSDEASERFFSSDVLKEGDVGEILVRGPVMTRAYDRLPEETHKAKSIQAETGELWHRIGDVGYRDHEGKLWFCGRKAERVILDDGTVLYTDPVEAVFNCHAKVFRSALIGLVDRAGKRFPAVVIEPELGCWPSGGERNKWIQELCEIARQHAHTSQIKNFFFCRKFPVDVRHNAKIHRLTLQRRYQKSLS